MRASDAADESDGVDGDGNKMFFNHIGLSYRYYMSGNDDAIADLDDELRGNYGKTTLLTKPVVHNEIRIA